jgi:hypothetical protein
LSNGFANRLGQLFRPQLPLWACELTGSQVVVAGVDGKRSRIPGKATVDLPKGVLEPSLASANIHDVERLKVSVQTALRAAGYKGSEISVVIPDEAARISFVTAETLPKTVEEQHTFLRWKLKKTVPFDVDTAQIAFKVIGSAGDGGGKTHGIDLLVAFSPRNVIQEYESLFDALDIHAGSVVPSTLAALNLLNVSAGDTLFVKMTPESVTTTILLDKHVRFYRRVAELGLYESVYPTVLYYQDKLGGTSFKEMVVCAQDPKLRSQIGELQDRIGIPVQALGPKTVDDIFKPALGAVHLSWTNLI